MSYIERWCPKCGGKRRFCKSFGIGSLMLLLLTGGLSLLLYPFYKKRCIVCGLRASKTIGIYVD